jgi:hypothetical protein
MKKLRFFADCRREKVAPLGQPKASIHAPNGVVRLGGLGVFA